MITKDEFPNAGSTDIKKEVLPTPPPDPTAVALPAAELVKINLEELKDNSILLVKLAPEAEQQRYAASLQIITALKPHFPLLKKKGIVIVMMGIKETIQVLDEEEMEQNGWVKKQKGSIILPNASDIKGISMNIPTDKKKN